MNTTNLQAEDNILDWQYALHARKHFINSMDQSYSSKVNSLSASKITRQRMRSILAYGNTTSFTGLPMQNASIILSREPGKPTRNV
jgi:hypothetical protein